MSHVSLRIWHVESDASAEAVDGIAAYVWAVALEQVRAGHAVTLFSKRQVDEERRLDAAIEGIRVVCTATTRSWNPRVLLTELRHERPDVVQLHGAWFRRNAVAAQALRRHRVPYVYTAHGGLAEVVRRTKPLRRLLYTRLIERPLVEGAAGMAAVSGAEVDEVRDVAPGFDGAVRVVHPPVPVLDTSQTTPTGSTSSRPELLFLGRFSVFQKGIDDLIEIARALPEADFHLVGSAPHKEAAEVDRLRATAPANVTFHEPVHGVEKLAWLRRATVYVQPSRFEGFPVSVTEAMSIGRPCAISERMAIAREFQESDLGEVLPTDPAAAAGALRRLLADDERQVALGERARRYVEDSCRPGPAAAALVDLYRESISRSGHPVPTG